MKKPVKQTDKLMTLAEAIERFVPDGASVAMGLQLGGALPAEVFLEVRLELLPWSGAIEIGVLTASRVHSEPHLTTRNEPQYGDRRAERDKPTLLIVDAIELPCAFVWMKIHQGDRWPAHQSPKR